MPAPFENQRRGEKWVPVVPNEDLETALRLPALLIDELERPQADMENTRYAIRHMAKNIELGLRGTAQLYKMRGAHRVTAKERLRRMEDERFGKDEMPKIEGEFSELARAIYSASPKEIEYFGSLFEDPEAAAHWNPDKVKTTDCIAPQPFEEGADAVEGRLALNTPENLKDLIKIAESSSVVSVIENMSLTATLLSACMAYGDHEQTKEALDLLGRMHMVSSSAIASRVQQVVTQREGSQEVAELALKVAHGKGLNDVVRSNIIRFVEGYDEVIALNQLSAAAWLPMLFTRQLSLNGGQPVDFARPPFSETRLFNTVGHTDGKSPEFEPEPDERTTLLGKYAVKVESYLSRVHADQSPLLSTNEIKRRKLDEARSILVRGATNEDSQDIVVGRSKEEARRYISDVEFLRSFITAGSGDLATAKDKLEAAVKEDARTAMTIDALLNEPGGRRSQALLNLLNVEIPSAGALGELVESIKEDWPTVEFMVSNYWPGGPETAEQIRKLLFLPRDDIEEESRVQVEVATPDESSGLESEEVVDIKPLESQNALDEIARQLDEVILPPRATKEDVKRVVEESGLSGEATSGIDWDRLFTLVRLRELNGGVMYRSKTGDLGNAPPYFVVAIQAGGNTYAVAESPVEGNATYIVSEKLCPGTWLEVLALSKEEARAVGAQRVIHRGEKSGDYHLYKVQSKLFDLMTVEA